MKQASLAEQTGFQRYSKKTKRALFLEGMKRVVPCGKLCSLVEPHYPKAGNGRGRASSGVCHEHERKLVMLY